MSPQVEIVFLVLLITNSIGAYSPGDLDMAIGSELTALAQRNLIDRLEQIYNIESKLEAFLIDDSERLVEAKAVLASLRADVKQLALDNIKEMSECLLVLTRHVHDKLAPTRRKEKRSVELVNELGLALTIRTFEQSQTNFGSLLHKIDLLETQLARIFDTAVLQDDQSLDALEQMKQIVKKYEGLAVNTIHQAVVNLNHVLLQPTFESSGSGSSSPREQSNEDESNATTLSDVHRVKVYDNGDVYEGMMRGQMKHGNGTYHFQATGDKYVGEFTWDALTGRGKYFFSAGDTFEGHFWHGLKHGHDGVYISGKRGVYLGDFEYDQATGRGNLSLPSGDRYEGEFLYGLMHGRGKYTSRNGDRYEGEFKNDKRAGKGVVYYASGSRFIGIFRDNQRTPFGTLGHKNEMAGGGEAKQQASTNTTTSFSVGYVYLYVLSKLFEKAV